MNKIQQLELMDKIQRELKDLEQSQTAVLKKVSQIAAHNISLGAKILDQKLPDLQDKIDASVITITEISEAFDAYREKFFADNKMATQVDPTA
jgi:dGTP triphosphohydrolase